MRIDPFDTFRPVARSPWRAVVAAVMRLAGEEAALLHHGERPWASVTLEGARHTISLTFAGAKAAAAGERFIAALPEHEFTIPRHLVAEATVTSVQHALLPEPEIIVEAELLLLDYA